MLFPLRSLLPLRRPAQAARVAMPRPRRRIATGHCIEAFPRAVRSRDGFRPVVNLRVDGIWRGCKAAPYTLPSHEAALSEATHAARIALQPPKASHGVAIQEAVTCCVALACVVFSLAFIFA